MQVIVYLSYTQSESFKRINNLKDKSKFGNENFIFELKTLFDLEFNRFTKLYDKPKIANSFLERILNDIATLKKENILLAFHIGAAAYWYPENFHNSLLKIKKNYTEIKFQFQNKMRVESALTDEEKFLYEKINNFIDENSYKNKKLHSFIFNNLD